MDSYVVLFREQRLENIYICSLESHFFPFCLNKVESVDVEPMDKKEYQKNVISTIFVEKLNAVHHSVTQKL